MGEKKESPLYAKPEFKQGTCTCPEAVPAGVSVEVKEILRRVSDNVLISRSRVYELCNFVQRMAALTAEAERMVGEIKAESEREEHDIGNGN